MCVYLQDFSTNIQTLHKHSLWFMSHIVIYSSLLFQILFSLCFVPHVSLCVLLLFHVPSFPFQSLSVLFLKLSLFALFSFIQILFLISISLSSLPHPLSLCPVSLVPDPVSRYQSPSVLFLILSLLVLCSLFQILFLDIHLALSFSSLSLFAFCSLFHVPAPVSFHLSPYVLVTILSICVQSLFHIPASVSFHPFPSVPFPYPFIPLFHLFSSEQVFSVFCTPFSVDDRYSITT